MMMAIVLEAGDGQEEMLFLCAARNLVEEGGALGVAELENGPGDELCDCLGVETAGQCKSGLGYHRQRWFPGPQRFDFPFAVRSVAQRVCFLT
jgi:hypothetical protein